MAWSPACSFAYPNIRHKAFRQHPKEDNKNGEESRREYVWGMNSWIFWTWTLLTVTHPGHHQPRSWGILWHSASCIQLVFRIYTHFWDLSSNLSFKGCFFLGILFLVRAPLSRRTPPHTYQFSQPLCSLSSTCAETACTFRLLIHPASWLCIKWKKLEMPILFSPGTFNI